MTFNRQIRRLGLALMVLFVALFAQLNYLQVVRADKYREDPRNTRNAVRDFSQPRGDIISADGAVLARSVDSGDSFKRLRQYPPETARLFAHVTGFFSFTFGSTGVERSYNDELSGRAEPLELDRLADLLLDRKRTANVTLTLSTRVQAAAANALGDRKGSVVALDPRTGAVLALWSFPSFDPNALSAHDQAAVRQAWDTLNADGNRPLLARTYRERFFPGSTFKVVTAAAGLASGKVTTTTPVYPPLRELDLPQTNRTLRNFGGGTCGGPLPEILKVSCNTAFAQMGIDLGADTMAGGARDFGFERRPPLDLSPGAVASAFADASAFAQDLPALARSAIGQQDVAATPLQMALVAGTIGNGGVAMKPHVVAEVRDDEGEVLREAGPQRWLTAVPPEVAATVRDMMVGVVNGGTARAIAVPGVQVAAKTGTAQLGTEPPSSHAWIIGFAPADVPRVAVAVIVEAQPGVSEITGGRVAAPIARAVIQAALATS